MGNQEILKDIFKKQKNILGFTIENWVGIATDDNSTLKGFSIRFKDKTLFLKMTTDNYWYDEQDRPIRLKLYTTGIMMKKTAISFGNKGLI